MARKGLGRGLSSLLGDSPATSGSGVLEKGDTELESQGQHASRISVDLLSPNPFQPRVEFDPESLAELESSISTHGILQPLLVRHHPHREGHYQIIAGERRYRAAQNVGVLHVPIQVRQATDQQMMEIAIVENVQRDDLNPIEEAKAYRQLMEAASLSQAEVAEKVGKSRSSVANLLRLLDLPVYVQDSIEAGEISQGHGKILAGLQEEECRKAWNFARTKQASVRGLEDFLKRALETPATGKPKTEKNNTPVPNPEQASIDLHLKDLEEALMERLRTKVNIVYRKDSSGYVNIEFFNREDLDRLLESLDIEL